MKKKSKKDDKTYKFIMKYMDKFDLLIKIALMYVHPKRLEDE